MEICHNYAGMKTLPTQAFRHRTLILLLVLLPLFGNAASIWFNADPTLQLSLIGVGLRGGVYAGPPGWIDPSAAYITQPLGFLAASDWLHGIIPWWNPYAGVGMPLAAETQTEAFFLPFVFLLHFKAGWLWLRIVLQAMCGVFLYGFLAEIGLARRAAFLGAALFEFTPEFFLCPSAPIAPLPFLPLLLLGIERAAVASAGERRGGWSLIVIACAYSFYAGNPEVAYFDGMLAGLWAIWRWFGLAWPQRLRFTLKLCAGLLVAICLSAPLLIPAAMYTAKAYVGLHDGVFALVHMPLQMLPLQLFPQALGFMGVPVPTALTPSQLGSYNLTRLPEWVTLPVLALALAGLVRGRAARFYGFRLILAGWVVVWEARYLGVLPVRWLFNHVPGVSVMDATRYSGPAVDLALILLAAFALDDTLRQKRLSRWRLGLVGVVVGLLCAGAILPGLPLLTHWYHARPAAAVQALVFFLLAVILTLAVLAGLNRPARRSAIIAGALCLPVCNFVLPQLSGLSKGHLDTGLIGFLKQTTGLQRMASTGPFGLNFPDRYGIASVNYNALPAPKLWTSFAHEVLDPRADLNSFDMSGPPRDILPHLAAFPSLGVKYLVVSDALAFAPHSFAMVPEAAATTANPLPQGQDMSGEIDDDLGFGEIGEASLKLGTYSDTARGVLTLRICAGADNCRQSDVSLANAKDNTPTLFVFDPPLITHGRALTYDILRRAGDNAFVVWTGRRGGQDVPALRLAAPWQPPLKGLAYQGITADVLEFAAPARYAGTLAGQCKIEIETRRAMRADCARPDTLIRREMYASGWHVLVDGKPAAIGQLAVFQTVGLAAGQHVIRFYYKPPHIGLACLVAGFGLLLWGAACFWPLRRPAARLGRP